MTLAADAVRPSPLMRTRSRTGLLRAMAFAVGVGAGAMLFAATLHAVRAGGVGPGYLAGAQALGVALGAAAMMFSPLLRASRGAAAAVAAVSAVACLLVGATLGAGPVVLGWMLLVGVGVGVAVSRIDGCIAQGADPSRPASSVLTAAFFGALGAMAAPLVVHGAHIGGGNGYAAAAVAFAAVAAGWLAVRAPAARDEPPPARWRSLLSNQPWLLLFLAFLFGVVDNGVLALAPAEYFARGASEWVSALIGVAAAGGLAIAQICSVRSLESDARPSAGLGLSLSLVGLALSLAVLGAGPEALAGGALVLLTGGFAEFVFGFGLFLYLARARLGFGVAMAAFVAACGLGEFAGPLLMQALADAGLPGAGYWLVSVAAAAAAFACLPAPRRVELCDV